MLIFCWLLAGNVWGQKNKKTREQEEANTEHQQTVDRLLMEALQYVSQKQYRKAVDCLDSALLVMPDVSKARLKRGWLYIQLNNPAKALEDFEGVLQRDSLQAWAWLGKGKVLEKKGNDQEALHCYEKSLQISAFLVEAHKARGQLFMKNNRFQEAKDDFDLYLSQYPSDVEILNERATVLKILGDTLAALADWQKAITSEGSFVLTYYNRGIYYQETRQHQKAINDFSTVLLLSPTFAKAYWGRGLSLYKIGDYAKAKEDFTQCLQRGLKTADVYANLAATKLKLNDFKGALEDSQKALSFEPNHVNSLLTSGIAKQMLKDEKGACQDWKKAASLGSLKAERYVTEECK